MGLPGLTGVDHIGFTVPDLDQAHHFLTEVLGCEYMYTLGPYRHDDTDWMREHLNVDPRAVMQQLHFYRCGGRAIFEVFQYAAPDQRREQPRNSDYGGHHVAFYVDDLDAAVKYLRDQGVQILGERRAITRGGNGADRRIPARRHPERRDRARRVDPAGRAGRAAGRQPPAGARG